MQVLNSSTVPVGKRKNRFWRRQFAPEITIPQIIFDIAFGAVGPVICFVYDPIVFRRGIGAAPLFPDYQVFTYLFSAVQIAVLFSWLIFKPRNELARSMIAGTLTSGALFCLTTACILAPFSILGLVFGIGVFGFTPFLTAFIYLRSAFRSAAFRSSRPKSATLGVLAISVLLAVALPLLLSLEIRSVVATAVNEVVHGNPQQADFAAHRLIPLRFFAESEMNQIVNAYLTEEDPQRRERLKVLYHQITGEDIEVQARVLRD
jgi:hypothetical protein